VRQFLTLLVLLLPLCGCGRFLVDADARLDIPRPLNLRLTTEPALTNAAAGPVMEMVVRPPASANAPRVAVIDVDGLLLNQNMSGPQSAGENPLDLFREKLDAAAHVCAVVVRINSPGGGAAASQTLYQELQAFRQRTRVPVVACLLDVATGGAYYLATASDRIVAQPATVTGGVGVVLNLFNLQGTMEQHNVDSQSIKAGANIDAGSVTRKLTPDATRTLQEIADELHGQFKDAVRRGRPNLDPADGTTLDGRVFAARKALALGLIDQVGTLDDAIAEAKRLANQPDAAVVMFRRPNDPARTPYATTPNVPLQSSVTSMSVPGLDRSRMPTFLYLWQPDPTLERLGGR
jgi:protease-4